MSKTVAWYSVDDGDRYQFTPHWEALDRWAAQDAASDYHSNHDGWESSWPLTFALYATEDGPEVSRFSVDREAEPCFYAAAVKP